MNEFDTDAIDKKIKDAEKRMDEKGRSYDGLGEAIEELNKVNGSDDGIIIGPKDEVTRQRILKEIEDNAADDD